MRKYQIRTMTRSEMDTAVDWAAEEGWNPGLSDAACFAAADPDGFLVGLLDNEPIASISVVRYGARYGFLGFYIVKPAFRGHGYGWAIWQAGMARLADRVIGLDGVVDQQPNYRKSGFALSHKNIRFEGHGRGNGAADPEADLQPLADGPFEQLIEYDRSFFPDNRDAFLRAWLAQPGGVALGLRGGTGLHGYGVLRPCRCGYKIGPLFADGPDAADRLYQALAAHAASNQPLYLDVPANNVHAMALAQRHGMKPVFETARMYKGAAPELSWDRTFGVTSFELG